MSFFSRPSLEDLQFKQLVGSTLTLSGQTKIAKTTGLTLSNGAGSYVPIILTGGTSGETLTYINGQVVFRAPNISTTPIFNTCRPTTRVGIPTVDVGGVCSVQNFLEGYFFPSVVPSSSISIVTGGNIREYGDCSVGNLCWSVVRNTMPISDIKLSIDGSGAFNSIVIPNGGSQNGLTGYSYSFSCAAPGSGVTSTSVNFKVCANTCINEPTSGATAIIWSNKNFYFKDPVLLTQYTVGAVLSATTGHLSTTIALSTGMTFNNEFFYYAYPKVYGTPTFTIDGFSNNAWGNIGSGTLFTTTFVNTKGYANKYYVARSDNRISGTFNICIS